MVRVVRREDTWRNDQSAGPRGAQPRRSSNSSNHDSSASKTSSRPSAPKLPAASAPPDPDSRASSAEPPLRSPKPRTPSSSHSRSSGRTSTGRMNGRKPPKLVARSAAIRPAERATSFGGFLPFMRPVLVLPEDLVLHLEGHISLGGEPPLYLVAGPSLRSRLARRNARALT